MGLCDVINQFLDNDSFSDTSTTEQSDFTTSGVRGQHVDDFNTGNQNFSTGSLLIKGGGFSMDGISSFCFDWPSFVDGVSDDVHDSAEGFGSYGDFDG